MTCRQPSLGFAPPERCAYCNSTKVAPKGKRTKKLETIRLYHCNHCNRNFTPGPRAIRNKTYPIGEILEAISTYNQGYTLEETSKRISSRHGHPVHPSTISRWLDQHPTLTTYRRLRDSGRKGFHPTRVMPTTKLYHAQVYEYSYHRAKLTALRNGTLGGPPERLAPFHAVADFLEAIPTTCPHELFRREDGFRGSRLAPDFAARNDLIVMERRNAATETAALIIPSVGSNHERHPKLQRFMLTNDSATLAMEVPIWLDGEAIAAVEARYGITLVPPGAITSAPPHITGHIDILQVREGCVHLLDYKPDARTNKPIAQLTIYALALTHLIPGLDLFSIKCAWFNEHAYNEFFPRKLILPPARG